MSLLYVYTKLRTDQRSCASLSEHHSLSDRAGYSYRRDMYSRAPEPFDVAIALTSYMCQSPLTLAPYCVAEWQEVATFGYPIHAISGPLDRLNLNLWCHKGYVQRHLRPEDIHIGRHPEGFELDFLLGRGMSGAPLFVYKGATDIVIGVCIGSIRNEIIEDEFIEIQSDGTKYKELKLKIEEFGLAHDIGPLLEWRPKLLDGASLRDASRQ